MSISTDGVDYEALPAQMEVSQEGNVIFLNNTEYNMKVTYGANTSIKILSGTFKDEEGNLNSEINQDITPPVVQSVAVSENNKEVTITFNESVSDNTGGNLQDNVYLSKSDGYISLFEGDEDTEGDTVTVEDGKLVIRFAEALVDSLNQIAIAGNVLKDNAGNVSTNDTITPMIQLGADTTAPELLNFYFSSDLESGALNLFTLVFDEDVVSNTSDFNSGIYKYDPASYWGNGIDGTIEISGNTVIFHYNTPRAGNEYYYQISPNLLKDASGNVLSDYIYTNWIYPTDPLSLDDGYISHNGQWLNLMFSSDLADNTIVDGISHLRDKIKVSTDQGANFLSLAAEDVVTIQGNRLVVLFHDAKTSGTIQVRVEAGAVSNSHVIPAFTNAAIDTVIAYNTPDVKGYFFSNAASEFEFEDDGVWSAKVREVIVYDNNYDIERKLTSSEYSINAGKLTVNKGVFQEGNYYYIYIVADGYSTKQVQGDAFNSSELFYMTAPVKTVQGGILAKVNILRNEDIDTDYGSSQTVIFELMNGSTPVSIVASELDVYTGSYSAQFNVIDAATNPNYTVRAFVVSHFTNDYNNVGLNLTTEVTQSEFDLMLNEQSDNGGEGS